MPPVPPETDNTPVTVVEGVSKSTSLKSKRALDVDTVQVDDKLYDAKRLAESHPGGELFVRAFAGSDATEAFLSYHRRVFPHAKHEYALVEKGVTSAKPEGVDKEYLELCEIVEKVLPRAKSFAPFSYYIKVATILGAAVGLEVYIHYNKSYDWRLCALLGWVMALIGLNIQHDANHGAVSRNPMVNRFLGLSQNWIGGSSLDWIHQHVVQHHVNCNDVNHDPDIAGSSLLRINPLKPLLKHQIVQHIYIFGLIALFGFSVCIESFNHIIKGEHHKKMSELVKSHRVFEACTSIFFFLRWIVLPLYQAPSIYTMLNICPMFMVAGYYLAFFFIISHNFVGAHIFDRDNSPNYNPSFLYKQVTSSSNVGGAWLCFINGGLNYQIEHHLFPRISHCHYPELSKVVKSFCLSRNPPIPYVHFPTISENVYSCVMHLATMGNNEAPSTYEK